MISISDVPLVSAIIPTYNRSDTIRRAIDSALQQTYPNVEVIVVDDGSTDDTRNLLTRTYSGNARVRCIHVENGGVSRARNIGIQAAAGDFIAFLDSDDFWVPWKVELQLKCLALVPEAGMIWSDMDAVDEDGVVTHERYLRRMYTAYKDLDKMKIPLFATSRTLRAADLDMAALPYDVTLCSGNIFSQMIIGNVVHTSTCMLRRDRIARVGGFREDLRKTGEDYDFHLRTTREGPVAFVDARTVCYTVGRADQLTSPSPALWVAMALNTLSTLEPVLAQSAHLIDLPPGTVTNVLAETHAWVATALLFADRKDEAKQHATQSIRQNPLKLKPYWLWLMSCLPDSVRMALRALRRIPTRARAYLRRELQA